LHRRCKKTSGRSAYLKTCPTHHAAQTQPIVRSSGSENGQSPRSRTSSFSTGVFAMSRANASRAIERAASMPAPCPAPPAGQRGIALRRTPPPSASHDRTLSSYFPVVIVAQSASVALRPGGGRPLAGNGQPGQLNFQAGQGASSLQRCARLVVTQEVISPESLPPLEVPTWKYISPSPAAGANPFAHWPAEADRWLDCSRTEARSQSGALRSQVGRGESIVGRITWRQNQPEAGNFRPESWPHVLWLLMTGVGVVLLVCAALSV
jgi:hypothetical protein